MIHRRPFSLNIKLILFCLALGIVVGIVRYSHSIVEKLQNREKRITMLYRAAMMQLNSGTDGDVSFIFNHFVESDSLTDFPIIMTDPNRVPLAVKRLRPDSSRGIPEVRRKLGELIAEMELVNPPLVINGPPDSLNNPTISNYIFYDESTMVKDLRDLPYYELMLAILFILFAYAGFSYIKRSEQAHIWIGLSKETAHQLGTPLSSLLGWIELLRAQTDDPGLLSTVSEMQQDVEKLNRTAHRFSKIGSQAEFAERDITETVGKVADYFRLRAPRLGKRVNIIFEPRDPVVLPFNSELFEWVLENLLKNALDAIDGPEGRIIITMTAGEKFVSIDVNDNGRGIDMRRKKDIFRPGVSTKKRGWGIGLSLSKRIIENYHHGKLSLLETGAGKGSTFRIRLPLRPKT